MTPNNAKSAWAIPSTRSFWSLASHCCGCLCHLAAVSGAVQPSAAEDCPCQVIRARAGTAAERASENRRKLRSIGELGRILGLEPRSHKCRKVHTPLCKHALHRRISILSHRFPGTPGPPDLWSRQACFLLDPAVLSGIAAPWNRNFCPSTQSGRGFSISH